MAEPWIVDLADAVAFLRRSGSTVRPPRYLPGLFVVDGRELSIGQVIAYANQVLRRAALSEGK